MKQGENWINRNQRQFLKDIVPLDMPLSMQIEPTGRCNFQCSYCYHSLEKEKQRFARNMSMEIFRKFIGDLKEFPHKLKSLTFCGGGEPLLNNNIYEMITMANEIAEETVLLTNGSLLTKKRSDKLIESGLGILRVSLQGINAVDYRKNCNFDINFDSFLQNIEYFYKHKKETKLVLKMPDIAINTDDKKQKFYELFKNKCDNLTVQIISNLVQEINYENIQVHSSSSLYGDKLEQIEVCPQIFFTMILDQDGNVFPCSDAYYNLTSPKIGNIQKKSLKEIWESDELRVLRNEHLKGNRFKVDSCKNCTHINALNNKFDNLDKYKCDILKNFAGAVV